MEQGAFESLGSCSDVACSGGLRLTASFITQVGFASNFDSG